MTKCSQFESQGVSYLYDELSEEKIQAFEVHLQDCSICQNQLASMRQTLSIMDRRTVPSPDEIFWKSFDAKLSEAIAEKPKNVRLIGSPWVQGLAAVAILVIGVLIGKNLSHPEVPLAKAPITAAEALPEQVFFETAGNYVQRSKTLLIGMVNMDLEGLDDAAIDLSLQRRMSRELISQASYLRNNYPKRGGDRLMELMNDLEIIFLQIAHLEANGSVEGLEIIRYGVNQSDLMLKINLEQLQPSIPRPKPDQKHQDSLEKQL